MVVAPGASTKADKVYWYKGKKNPYYKRKKGSFSSKFRGEGPSKGWKKKVNAYQDRYNSPHREDYVKVSYYKKGVVQIRINCCIC